MGDRTAIPHTATRGCGWWPTTHRPRVLMRGVSALPNVFAHESYADELAHLAGIDPIAFRRRYLDDQRALALIDALVAPRRLAATHLPNPERAGTAC